MDLGSDVITGVRHMQPRWEEQLIPDPDGLPGCLAKTYALLAGSGISNNTEEPQRGVVADP